MQFSVVNLYVNSISDAVDLEWLPIKERRDFHQLKVTFRSLYDPLWPSYLSIQKVTNTRELCSSNINRLVVPIEKGTFQDTAANHFNNLPYDIKLC